MPGIEQLAWDSEVLSARVGRVEDAEQVPSVSELAGFDFVHVRVPQENHGLIWRYQAAGFRFVTVDYTLDKTAVPSPAQPSIAGYQLETVSHEEPTFEVEGFEMEGSRLELDPQLRRRLPARFWDDMIRNHCRSFADRVWCAVDANRRLAGCITGFERPHHLELFLVIVHPGHKGRGLGRVLLQAAEAEARRLGKRLSTNVVGHNLAAMNFYFRHGFSVTEGEAVLHYSREQERR